MLWSADSEVGCVDLGGSGLLAASSVHFEKDLVVNALIFSCIYIKLHIYIYISIVIVMYIRQNCLTPRLG